MLIKLNGAKTTDEALEKAGLNWSVEPVELVTAHGRNVPTHKALYRSDTGNILGVVGRSYVPIQNSTAFAIADTIAEEYGAVFEYAGIIKEGRRVFLQAKLNDSYEVSRGDQVDSFITVSTSNDGSSSLRCFLTPIRCWCENKLIRAIKEATTNITMRHTANVQDRIQQAFQVFHMSTHAFQVFKQKSRYLAQKQVDQQMVERFLDSVIGETKESTRRQHQKQKVVELFENGRGNNSQNSWQLYNAAVEWVDHERGSNPEKRLDSAMFGSGAVIKEKAFQSALSL